jgi:hypothetical protein
LAAVARYRVCFEEKWQRNFDDQDDALAWGREMGETGRLVHVVRRGLFRTKLIAVFPESQTEEGIRLWKLRTFGHGAAR